MKILFGVQTTGNGHISCSRVVVSALKAAGHNVTVLFSGAERSAFWNCSKFEPFTQKRGLTFVVDRGTVSTLETLFQTRPLQLIRDIRSLDLRPFDVVISNFEPITAWAAKLQNRPSIGLSHQAAFRADIPKAPGNLAARIVLRCFAPTHINLGLHWASFGQALLPPVLDASLLAASPALHSDSVAVQQDHGLLTTRTDVATPSVLVCLPFENIGHVTSMLQRFTAHRFRFYADVHAVVQRGNVTVLPFGRESFLQDLRACSGVIAHAGFELPSEALHLGKKLLVRPLGNQYEQQCNALALTRQGLATAMPELQARAVAAFLEAPPASPKRYPDVAAAIAHWLPEADLSSPQAHTGLATSLWQQTQ